MGDVPPRARTRARGGERDGQRCVARLRKAGQLAEHSLCDLEDDSSATLLHIFCNNAPVLPLPQLVLAWGRGWAVSRGLPEPVEVSGGFRANVGVHGHRVRYVDSAGYLMSAPLTACADVPPTPYEIQITTKGEVVVATVVDMAGATAASGRLAPAGNCAVIDQVETAPAHRRRGLGTTIMRALSNHAARAGLDTGILVATADGRGLYHALGWTVRSEIAAAYVRED
jgi:GNAT superfamily N-acetyltransferase